MPQKIYWPQIEPGVWSTIERGYWLQITKAGERQYLVYVRKQKNRGSCGNGFNTRRQAAQWAAEMIGQKDALHTFAKEPAPCSAI